MLGDEYLFLFTFAPRVPTVSDRNAPNFDERHQFGHCTPHAKFNRKYGGYITEIIYIFLKLEIMQLTENFQSEEFACKDGARVPAKMSSALKSVLDSCAFVAFISETMVSNETAPKDCKSRVSRAASSEQMLELDESSERWAVAA